MISSDEEIPRREQSAKYSIEYFSGENKKIIFQKISIEKDSEILYKLTSSGKKMYEEGRKLRDKRKCRNVRKNLYRENSDSSSEDSCNEETSQKAAIKSSSKISNTSSNKLNEDSISNLLNDFESDDNGSIEVISDDEIDIPKERGDLNLDDVVCTKKNMKSKSTATHQQENVTVNGKKEDESECEFILKNKTKTKQDNSDNWSKQNCSTPSKKKRFCVEPSKTSLKGNKNESVSEEIQLSKSYGLDSPCVVSTKIKENLSTPKRNSCSIQSSKENASPTVYSTRRVHNSCENLRESCKKTDESNGNKLTECNYTTPSKRRRYMREVFNSPVKSSDEGNKKETVDEEIIPSQSLHRPVSAQEKESHCTPERKAYSIQSFTRIATPTTPSTRKGTPRRLHLTPSMPVCKRNLGTPKTPLQDAMTRLHVSAVPCSLPCREDEFRNIFNFLEGKLLDGAGGCMYISGVPGTGKTATVREAVNTLQQMVADGDLSDFQFIEINGMRLSHPRQAYVQLWKSLSGEVLTPEQAQRLLENKFTRSSKKSLLSHIVLLVDEVDVLWTKRQDVVYNLLDWPSKAKSGLVVVTIANTMDLPERLLMGRVTSRLGLTRLTFQPYTHKQLEEIVKARLEGIIAFDADAIQFVSRKVASVSGDARRALDICRRATEIAEVESPQNLVTIKHVDEAMSSMTSSCTVQAIMQACSTMEQMFLQAVEAELGRTGLEETTFRKAYTMLETLCSLEGLNLPTPSQAIGVCMRLTSLRLLLSQHSHMDVYSRIFLNISVDDLHYALQEVRREKNNRK